MDILIKNMEMPQYCYAEKDHYIIKPCPFLQTCYKEWGSYINAINVHSDACPLVALPEHGRLIDGDELRERAEYINEYDLESEKVDLLMTAIRNEHTVLEAST